MTPTRLSVAEAGAEMRAGRLTSAALTRAHLDLVAARNDDCHAFVAVTADRALAAAARADSDLAAGIDHGPMQGIPFAVKDIVDMAGAPTLCGSRARPARPAAADAAPDAAVVARLLAAGAVPLGKVATYEFALVGPSSDGPYPPARNPWNPGRITGGSSSGSAAAIAAGLVRVAVGTDTGGSVRSPAAYCGVVGLKPTRDALPRDGVFPLSPSLDHVGLLGATVADTAAAYAALTGMALPSGGIAGLTLGFARDWFAEDPATHPGVLQAVDAAMSDLTLLGARARLIDLPDYALFEAAGAIVLHAEALDVHRLALARDWDRYGRLARQSLAGGATLGAGDVDLARQAGARLRDAVNRRLDAVDALVTATVLTPAPPVPDPATERAAWTAMRTLPFNVTGHPALSVPCGFVDGLPVAVQIVGRPGDEATLCRIGAAFEAATDHAAQRPFSR